MGVFNCLHIEGWTISYVIHAKKKVFDLNLNLASIRRMSEKREAIKRREA